MPKQDGELSDAAKTCKEMIEAANARDHEKMQSLFTEDCVYEDVALGRICHGKDELINFTKAVAAYSPDHKWEWKSSFGELDKVATEWIWTGTIPQPGSSESLATSQQVTIRGISITELHNGKIRRNSDYYQLPSPKK